MLYIFLLVITLAFHALIYQYLEQRDSIQHVYSVVQLIALK